jgi:hypothetical protein
MSLRSARPQSLANVTYLELVLHSTVAGSAFSRRFGTPKQRPIQVFGLSVHVIRAVFDEVSTGHESCEVPARFTTERDPLETTT